MSSDHDEDGYGGYSGANLGPRLVSVPFAQKLSEYLDRALELGALEGPLGEMDLAPDLFPLIDGIHHVLAGGAVKVEVERKGNPDIVKQLARLREKGRDDSNVINRESGYYATPTS